MNENPKLFINLKVEELIGPAPDLTDCELEELGAKIVKDINAAELIAKGRN